MTEPTSPAEQLAAAIARAEQAEARLAELESSIAWETSCLSCARVLDSCYAETRRAEQAEARITALQAECDGLAEAGRNESRIWAARADAVRALHYPETSMWDGLQCYLCGDPGYPCDTVKALDGAAETALDGPANSPAAEESHVCKPGSTVYYCPTAGEFESSCHGGFDVCCAAPELHRPCDHRDPKLLAARPSDLAVFCACGAQVFSGLRPDRL